MQLPTHSGRPTFPDAEIATPGRFLERQHSRVYTDRRVAPARENMGGGRTR